MKNVIYVIWQELRFEKESAPFSVLFGFTASYEVVCWFGQNQRRFHSKITIEQWKVSSKEELWGRIQKKFALQSFDEVGWFYLEMRSNKMQTLEKPLYVNQIDSIRGTVSSYAYTFSELVYESIVSFVYQMLCIRVNELEETVSHDLVQVLRLFWKYVTSPKDCLWYERIGYMDEVSLQLDMIEYDDDGDNSYYGY